MLTEFGQTGVLSADPRRASQCRGVGGRRWVVRRDLVAEAPRYGSSGNPRCGCDGWLRIREDLAALSPTHQQRPRPARCVCTAPTGGPGAVKGDGASAHRLQRRGVVMAESRNPLQAGALPSWRPEFGIRTAPPVSPLRVWRLRRRVMWPRRGSGLSRDLSDLVFSGQTFQTLRGVTANLGLAVTSAGCTGPYAAPGR
jgi:hypothetical protein